MENCFLRLALPFPFPCLFVRLSSTLESWNRCNQGFVAHREFGRAPVFETSYSAMSRDGFRDKLQFRDTGAAFSIFQSLATTAPSLALPWRCCDALQRTVTKPCLQHTTPPNRHSEFRSSRLLFSRGRATPEDGKYLHVKCPSKHTKYLSAISITYNFIYIFIFFIFSLTLPQTCTWTKKKLLMSLFERSKRIFFFLMVFL